MQELYSQNTAASRPEEVSKVLRNTYAMLALTLAFSALTATLSIAAGVGHGVSLIMSLGAIGILWFVLPKTANSGMGILVVFAFTGLLGASIGPLLSHYLAMPSGSAIVMQALGGTALVFFALSGYVLTTGKDFSFLGGFLMVGLVVAIVAMLGIFVAGFFGVQIAGFHLAISALIVMIMSGFILYDTSRIINGGETNYLFATASLYLNIFNLFTALLHLIGALNDD